MSCLSTCRGIASVKESKYRSSNDRGDRRQQICDDGAWASESIRSRITGAENIPVSGGRRTEHLRDKCLTRKQPKTIIIKWLWTLPTSMASPHSPCAGAKGLAVKMRNMSFVAGLSISLVSGFWAACLGQTAAGGASAPTSQPSVTVTSDRTVTLAPATQPGVNSNVTRRGMGPKMARSLGGVDIAGLSIRQALNWWSNASGVNLVINWDELARGRHQPRKVGRYSSAGPVWPNACWRPCCGRREDNGQILMGEKQDGFIQVVTKAYADAHPVLRMYDVDDLLVEVPDFQPALDFDIARLLGSGNNNNNNSGNNGGNNNGNNTTNSLFGQSNNGQSNGTPRMVVAGRAQTGSWRRIGQTRPRPH